MRNEQKHLAVNKTWADEVWDSKELVYMEFGPYPASRTSHLIAGSGRMLYSKGWSSGQNSINMSSIRKIRLATKGQF